MYVLLCKTLWHLLPVCALHLRQNGFVLLLHWLLSQFSLNKKSCFLLWWNLFRSLCQNVISYFLQNLLLPMHRDLHNYKSFYVVASRKSIRCTRRSKVVGLMFQLLPSKHDDVHLTNFLYPHISIERHCFINKYNKDIVIFVPQI